MKRLFAAIKIKPPEGFLHIYYGLKANLKNDKIKWVDINNIHLTLKFLGETPNEQIPNIVEKLGKISLKHSNFSLEFRDIGIFGSSYKPRMIWIGVEENKVLLSLAKDILIGMDDIGFKRDRQNFVPHLTLGRIKFIDDKNRFQQIITKYSSTKMEKQEITEFNLYESILKREGPEYKLIESFNLK